MRMVTRVDPVSGRLTFFGKDELTGEITPCPIAGGRGQGSAASVGVTGSGCGRSSGSSSGGGGCEVRGRIELEGEAGGDDGQAVDDDENASDDEEEEETSLYKKASWMKLVVSKGPLDLPKLKVNGPVNHKAFKSDLSHDIKAQCLNYWEDTNVSWHMMRLDGVVS